MARLKFVKPETEEQERLQSAVGMYAKDGEYVEFTSQCDCNGPVSHVNKAPSFRLSTPSSGSEENCNSFPLVNSRVSTSPFCSCNRDVEKIPVFF